MTKAKLSIIVTVFNEQSTILKFIESVFNQSKPPSELIIVDGGSKDRTLQQIKKYKRPRDSKIRISVIVKIGNRSAGRNEAIRNSKGEIILCSDAGCTFDSDWIKNISKPFSDKSIDVVAGYYKGLAKNVFQKCLIPYVLVMSDKVDENDFLPATRSMAFKKSVWKRTGGFDENLSHNEDYAFANKIKKMGAKIVFEKKAVVNWIPRQNLQQAFVMFFRFAFGDGEAGILRDKVLLIFARYAFYLYLIVLTTLIKSFLLLDLVIAFTAMYILWSIYKNYKYVRNKNAFFILPILQIASDTAVLVGTILGFVKFILKIDYKSIFKNNLKLILLLIIYIITMLLVIKSGIPNKNHPFPYQMDEWHQLQAIRDVFKYGSPNLPGSANGTMFNFFLSGLMLLPFYLLKVINPFLIKSSVDALQEQEKLFIALRIITLFFGSLTLLVMSRIAKMLKLNQFLAVLLFLFVPVWLSLSNFFKYDIALIFWIVLSLYFLIKYYFSSTTKYFIFACFFSGIAFAVKVSGIPLLPMIMLAFFLFTPKFNKKYFRLFLGLLTYLFTAIFLGIPDIIFGNKNMYDYLYSNLIGHAQYFGNYNLPESLLTLTIFHKFSVIFGHTFYILSVIALFYLLFKTILMFINKRYQNVRLNIFIIFSLFIFSISLMPLGIWISANRAIVLLPFMVIVDLIVLRECVPSLKFKSIFHKILITILILLVSIQIIESCLWVWLKISILPQQSSSAWVLNNIPNGSNIGLENIPIYQFEPDFILKEFYNKQYYQNIKTKFNYFIVDEESKNLPKYIVLSNVNYELKYYKSSLKNALVKRMRREEFVEIANFPLQIPILDNLYKESYYHYVGLFAYPESIIIFEKK